MSNQQIGRLLIACFLTASLFGLVSVQHSGADQASYQIWSKALLQMRLPSEEDFNGNDLTSPIGIPYQRHYPGAPGIVALPKVVFQKLGIPNAQIQNLLGAVSIIALVTMLVSVVRLNIHLWSTAAAMSLFATPFGLNVLSQGSTAQLSLIPASLIVLEIGAFVRHRSVSHFNLALATAILFSIRAYLIVYPVSLAMAMLILEKKQWLPVVVHLSGIAVGASFYLATNYLMTGEPLTPLQDFGDDRFKTIDLFEPQYFLPFIFSPFHSVVAIHPLMLLLPIIAVLNAFHFVGSKNYRELAVHISLVFAVSAHIYVQSCWYHWSLDLGFGNRSMVFPALVCTYFVMSFLVGAHSTKMKRSLLFVVGLGICFSFLFSLDVYYAGYYSWQALIREAKFEFYDWLGLGVLGTGAFVDQVEYAVRPATLAFSVLLASVLFRLSSTESNDRIEKCVGGISLALVLAYTLDRIFLFESRWAASAFFVALVASVGMSVHPFSYNWIENHKARIVGAGKAAFKFVVLVSFLFFAVVYALAITSQFSKMKIVGAQTISQGAWGDAVSHRRHLSHLAANDQYYEQQLVELDQFIERNIGFLKNVDPGSQLGAKHKSLIEKLKRRLPKNYDQVKEPKYDANSRRARQRYILSRKL